mgnify:CR=1 FL=1
MKLKLKDPWSAITHGIAVLLAAAGAAPLLIKAARTEDTLHITALAVFITDNDPSLYGKYRLSLCRLHRKSKPQTSQIDHMMILL